MNPGVYIVGAFDRAGSYTTRNNKVIHFCEVVVRTDTATEIRRISSMNDVFGRFKRDDDVVIPVRFAASEGGYLNCWEAFPKN